MDSSTSPFGLVSNRYFDPRTLVWQMVPPRAASINALRIGGNECELAILGQPYSGMLASTPSQ